MNANAKLISQRVQALSFVLFGEVLIELGKLRLGGLRVAACHAEIFAPCVVNGLAKLVEIVYHAASGLAFLGRGAILLGNRSEVVPENCRRSASNRTSWSLRPVPDILSDAHLGRNFGTDELQAVELRGNLERGMAVLLERMLCRNVPCFIPELDLPSSSASASSSSSSFFSQFSQRWIAELAHAVTLFFVRQADQIQIAVWIFWACPNLQPALHLFVTRFSKVKQK
mmetsp:Transcript_87126/g.164282  ORF Transcript_87126/g.164282 Transcript_87126/m.164282 type:complete len:227 (+) Transcript_87126:634-1314(+)